MMRLAGGGQHGNNSHNSDEGGEGSRMWHFPMLPPCPLGVPIVKPRDHLPTQDPDPVRLQVSISWKGRVATIEKTVAGRHEAEEVALLLGRALQFYDIPSQANDVDLAHFHPSQPFRGGGTYYWTETTAPLTYITQRLRLGVMAVIGGGT
ncbi:hypothetical protein T484DRAFT_2022293 [Baffinella frigidus]|nr:hypothetical protein T484DRAFT_2022293 [Cryptophyta sp. CCMP2293]